MGNYCACCVGSSIAEILFGSNSKAGRKVQLDRDYLETIKSSVASDALVAIVRVKALHGINQYAVQGDELCPYVEMKLIPPDSIAGEQVQKTSYIPNASDNTVPFVISRVNNKQYPF
jgi:hypothetical protein